MDALDLYDIPISSDSTSTASGETLEREITQALHGFVFGDILRLDDTTYVKALADSEENAEVIGIVSAVTDENTFTITESGLIEGFVGLTPDLTYFLSRTVPGAYIDTDASNAGEISKPILIADTATSATFINMRGMVYGTPFFGNIDCGGADADYSGVNPIDCGGAI